MSSAELRWGPPRDRRVTPAAMIDAWLAVCADELELDVETVAEVVGVLAVRRAVTGVY